MGCAGMKENKEKRGGYKSARIREKRNSHKWKIESNYVGIIFIAGVNR